MRIIALQAENVKKLRAVSIKPDPEDPLVVVGGRNAAGKSSVLDAIWYALGGKAAQPDRPVREGQKKAKIELDLGDLVVTRTITAAGGGTLKVTGKDGRMFSSPQALLDKFVERRTIDPLAFFRLSKSEQVNVLKSVVGLDFSKWDEQRRAAYEKRTEINRELKSVRSMIVDGPELPDDLPAEKVNVSELVSELQELRDRKESAIQQQSMVDQIKGRLDAIDIRMEELRQQMAALRKRKADLEQEYAKAISSLEDSRIGDIESEEQKLVEQINAANEINQAIDQREARNELFKRRDVLQNEVAALTGEIAELDRKKEDAIRNARLPIPGLSFDENGVTYNGVPLDQASSAEQLRVSVALGFALNPELKVLLIRDGSLLDDDNLALIREMASQIPDAQVWIERVGEGEECSIIIEDGEVRA